MANTREQVRIAVFGQPRAPWRNSVEEAKADAIALKLASWDAGMREWFIAVPLEVRSPMCSGIPRSTATCSTYFGNVGTISVLPH
jgi:hypothetical protein